jgi:multidrug efflux pump subunit AcrA (membrane-fusion protein)
MVTSEGDMLVVGELESAPSPELHRGDADVLLSAEIGGRRYQWKGRIVRTEGTLDPQTRMITAVARIEDPYARADDSDRPPLSMGLFVSAEIRGRTIDDLYELPRSALRERDGAVVIVDDEQRLRLRRVEVLRTERERVWIAAGLTPGERVVITPLDVFVEGSVVRTTDLEGFDSGATAAKLDGEDRGT